MKIVYLIFSLLLIQPALGQIKNEAKKDAGTWEGRTRSFFMTTHNEGDLSDNYALGLGAGLGYQSPSWKRLSLKTSAFYIRNVFSNDLSQPDPKTNAISRYEIGLFDVADPSKKDIFKIEELYAQYSWAKSQIRLGRQLINTPFINPQDGRMSPNFVSGLWYSGQISDKSGIRLGWLSHMSPRSTSGWFTVAQSFGYYPMGLNPDGTQPKYFGNVKSAGIAFAEWKFRQNKAFGFEISNTYVENVLQNILLQTDGALAIDEQSAWQWGLQYIRQDAIGNGGNENPELAYITQNSSNNVVGIKTGMLYKRLDFSLNYTRISSQSRFLFPREWGRDPFFTFLPRERNEGFGGVNATVFKLAYDLKPKVAQLSFGHGRFEMPAANIPAKNKYGIPSYHQTNIEFRYQFQNKLQGLSMQYLLVYKGKTGDSFNNDRFVINKVNMLYQNVVFNYELRNKSIKL